MDVTVTMPVFNQVHYTKQCVESYNHAGVPDEKIIVINNASTDGTENFLATRPKIKTVNNPSNLGCGAAWAQGAELSGSTWTIVTNNDVLVPQGFIEGLVSFAEEKNFDLVGPAMCEGATDYDFSKHAAEFMARMKNVFRRGIGNGVCFMVHRRVFEKVGYFDRDPKVGGYADDEFFRRARSAGFQLAITGRAFLHHFGSVTQKSIKSSHRDQIKMLGDREYYRRKTNQTWPKRKLLQVRDGVRAIWWKNSEQLKFGNTLREKRLGGRWIYL